MIDEELRSQKREIEEEIENLKYQEEIEKKREQLKKLKYKKSFLGKLLDKI